MTPFRGVMAALFVGVALFIATPRGYAAPPGSNDFACQPSAAHPRPVVMIHGLGGTEDEFFAISPKLKAAGYCVFSLTYGVDPRVPIFGGTIAMDKSAEQLKAFVEQVLTATGAAEVDFIGHSEGTVMPRWYLERLGGAPKVHTYVAWTPLWRGTKLLGADAFRDAAPALSTPLIDLVSQLCASCPQFLSGSPYLNDLNSDGEAIPGIAHTNIITRYDPLVVPYTSGVMSDGGTNIVVQDVCPNDFYEHSTMAIDPVAHQITLNALDPANAKPVTC